MAEQSNPKGQAMTTTTTPEMGLTCKLIDRTEPGRGGIRDLLPPADWCCECGSDVDTFTLKVRAFASDQVGDVVTICRDSGDQLKRVRQ